MSSEEPVEESSNELVLGDRVAVISDIAGRHVILEGYGVYAGKCYVPTTGIMEDRFLLDDNKVFLASECIFMREEEFEDWQIKNSMVITFKEVEYDS